MDYGAKHLFFYFFESRGNPDKDDVVMWINGGPGCSSSTGLLMEHGKSLILSRSYSAVYKSLFQGPCNIDITGKSANGTLWNPYAWINHANMFFLDQPYVLYRRSLHAIQLVIRVGVGFSYADYGETIETTEDAARNIYAFV